MEKRGIAEQFRLGFRFLCLLWGSGLFGGGNGQLPDKRLPNFPGLFLVLVSLLGGWAKGL